MKRITIFFIILLLQINIIQASKLDVKTNLESGEYEFVIDVNIIANDKNAKIFYYTDGEGRIDHIKEFSKPILIKENTQLDYYATSADYEDTLIKTSTYYFNYSNKIEIIGEGNKIIIENNSGKTQNIGYWKIEADNLNYEINPNTFLENKEIFELNYDLTDDEKIKLISPDKKIIKNFVYKIEKKGQPQGIAPTDNNVGAGLVPAQEKTETQIEEEKKEFDLNENLKTSTLDIKKTGNKNNIYIIILIFGSLILYNIGLFLTKTETYKKLKNKK